MIKYIILIILLVGCASNTSKPDIQYKPVTQQIAVYTPPSELNNIVIPTRPDLVKNHLTVEDCNKPDVVVRAYLMTINQLIKYSEDLETTIKNYQTIVNTTSKIQTHRNRNEVYIRSDLDQ